MMVRSNRAKNALEALLPLNLEFLQTLITLVKNVKFKGETKVNLNFLNYPELKSKLKFPPT